MLKVYSAKAMSADIEFDKFSAFLKKAAEQQPAYPGARDILSENAADAIESALSVLENDKLCKVEYVAGEPALVRFPLYYAARIMAYYKKAEESAEAPFPSERQMNMEIPGSLIVPITVKQDFSRLLEEDCGKTRDIYRFNFPEGIDSMIVPAELIRTKLLELSLLKVRLYLNTAKNAEYVRNRLSGLFRGKEQVLKDMFSNVLSQNRLSIDSILNPTDFTYMFWTHTASAVLAEFKQKKEKLVLEHSFCQGAYLVGFYALYHKGIAQRKKDKETALRGVAQNLKKAPYYFTFEDISGFKDSHGLLYSRKFSQPELYSFLDKITTEAEGEDLPSVIHVKGVKGRDYFICKDKLLSLTLRKIIAASQEYRKYFIDQFSAELNKFKKNEAMTSDTGLNKAIEEYMTEEDPLLAALLRFELLYLTLKDTKPGAEIQQETERLFDVTSQTLAPLNIVFRLDRKILLGKAKKIIPLWKTIPILKALYLLFTKNRQGRISRVKESGLKGAPGNQKSSPDFETGGVSVGVKKAEPGKSQETTELQTGRSGAGPVKADPIVEYKKAIYQLKVQFIGKDTSLDSALADYSEKWNPLYDPGAKANLVEDVNALVRDYLRSLKRGFIKAPPDAARIENLAKTLSDNQALAKIKKKELLRKYIELYMVKYLGQK